MQKHLGIPNNEVLELQRLAAYWEDTAAEMARNAEYYRSLLIKCGQSIGIEAYTQDDGGIVDDVLCAKIPELVENLVNSVKLQHLYV